MARYPFEFFLFIVVTMVVKTVLSPDEEAKVADPMAVMSIRRVFWEALV